MNTYKNEIVTVFVKFRTLVEYTIPTYENINSVTIISGGASLHIGINNPDYLTSTFYIRPNTEYTIFGNEIEKLNAPVILYADNIGRNANFNTYMYVIIKRFTNAKL